MVAPVDIAALERGECATCRRAVDLTDPIDLANYGITGECPDCIAATAGEDDE